MAKPSIGVIGATDPSPEQYQLAYDVGTLIAARGAVLVCGGLGGIMEAAAKGAHERGGIVLGILPGGSKADANPYVTVAVPTVMGVARNVLVVNSSDVLIAFPGAYGTLSEMAIALAVGTTVVCMPGAWDLKRISKVDFNYYKEAFDANQAVGMALAALAQRQMEPGQNQSS